MTTVYLGLGSNEGARERAIEASLESLSRRGFGLEARSALYLTEPVGGPPQEWYVNAVVRGTTALSPEALLQAAQAVEAELGRVRRERWGPRTIDVDLLFYGELVLDSPALTLPHPRLAERRFVLVPLAELDPALRHPRLGLSVAELLARCPDRAAVEPWQPQAAR